MGLLDGLLGKPSEIDPGKIQGKFAQILAPGEKIEKAYQLIRDLVRIHGQARASRVRRSTITRCRIAPSLIYPVRLFNSSLDRNVRRAIDIHEPNESTSRMAAEEPPSMTITVEAKEG